MSDQSGSDGLNTSKPASKPKYPGIRITANGNQLVSYHTEARITDAGIFYPITPSTEMGEMYQQAHAEGMLNVFGDSTVAVECEGEHAAQGGAIAFSVTGKRVVNFTSGQGVVYGVEQYYHAPGKLSTMVLQVAARALTKHALNVHCGHDDAYAVLDTGWMVLFAKDAQQAADQAVILRKVAELGLNPGINIQDGFLTSHLDRTFLKMEDDLLREFLGRADDIIDCPTNAQKVLFGPQRRRVPKTIDLKNPAVLGPVQNQEHYMNGVVARRDGFAEGLDDMLRDAFAQFAKLTGRDYGMVSAYRVDDAETVFVSLGSAAENIEAAVDFLRAKRGEKVGSVHINVLRPFPDAELLEALLGKQRIIVMERSDIPLASDNPLTNEIRAVFNRHIEAKADDVEAIPRVFSGVYGLGSRDFRPEGILGAYEYATGKKGRKDGRSATDGESFFVVGVDHPYAVVSDDTPSLLPDGAIAVRLHSIGGWGMITTGKNLAGVIGEMGDFVAKRDGGVDAGGGQGEAVHISANPRYGSEKKGAPTAYYLAVAPERVRVNCDLHHVNTVLCCDPKAFTHSNPLDGLVPGGVFIIESDEQPAQVWERIPSRHRQEIIEKGIKLYSLPGFDIARNATKRPELQLRMQGNAFLGAFFAASPFLEKYGIEREHFESITMAQYKKKFGRFGEAVVNSNMEVMSQGGARLQAVPHGAVDALDTSTMRGSPLLSLPATKPGGGDTDGTSEASDSTILHPPFQSMAAFDAEFRADLGYHQPASPLSSVGIVAAATGHTASKYVSRRDTPLFHPEKCTQCMSCISVCPDTALPNTSQDVDTVLSRAISGYVTNVGERQLLLGKVGDLASSARTQMMDALKKKESRSFTAVAASLFEDVDGISEQTRAELSEIIPKLPFGYQKVKSIFASIEKKKPGEGGLFGIFVSDLCKGCGECVQACGSHEALEMVPDNTEMNEMMAAQESFLDLLPETHARYLGKYDPEKPTESKTAVLQNHLMMRTNYRAIVSGDGACAGCGEKTVLRGLSTVTEAYMRPLYHAKASRLRGKASALSERGEAGLQGLKGSDPEGFARLMELLGWLLPKADATISGICEALISTMREHASDLRDLRAVAGMLPNGMSVMAMGTNTGCSSVYGSTPPNNPHPYPWMNSLFQDGATVAWLFGESFMIDHARQGVLPERFADILLVDEVVAPSEAEVFNYRHFSDTRMTDQEVREMPKAWAVGGDGGMGDIGFQNVSKVVMQNRPNVKVMVLDTQVYSNTGGQNSDSSPMTGGFDMNQWGAATQGKLVEKKGLAEIFASGHGSPYVAQVSAANPTRLYQSYLDGLDYRGTAFLQCYTPCQPEHGIGDDVSFLQSQRCRDARGIPEFSFDPRRGESWSEAMEIKGNPSPDRDWWQAKGSDKQKYDYTIAHWCATEARFRKHVKPVKADALDPGIPLWSMLALITQDDVVHRRFLDAEHRAYVPNFGVYIDLDDDQGGRRRIALSRQMVLYCVERRKSWRMLQSHAGVTNKDYEAQRTLLSRLDKGDVTVSDVREKGPQA